MDIIISTADGNVTLTGEEKEAFLADLPESPPVLETPKPLEEKIADGLKATGMTQAQIDAFLAAIK